MLITPRLRNDTLGAGHFGAPRGKRTHNGLDFCAAPGDVVYAVDGGVITKIGFCYGDDLRYRYTQVTTVDQLDARYFYTTPLPGLDIGTMVSVGDPLCVVQDIAVKHSTPGAAMKNHFHFEIKDGRGHINPVPYLKKCGVLL